MRDYPESITPADHIEPVPRRVRAVLNGAVVDAIRSTRSVRVESDGVVLAESRRSTPFLDGQRLERPHTTSRSSQRKDCMTTPIADEVARMHADAESRNASDSPFTREQAMLAAAGTPTGIASVGSTLPDARLLDPFGSPTTLSEALDGKAAVLVLYRGAWCPYCNLTLSTYKDQLFRQLLDQDVTLIAISLQAPDGSLAMQEKHELPFPVLSDPGNVLARALGILTQPSEETLDAQRQYGIELTEINADGTVELPMPTAVVVDSAATVRWIDVQPDYSVRTEPDEILAAVAEVLR